MSSTQITKPVTAVESRLNEIWSELPYPKQEEAPRHDPNYCDDNLRLKRAKKSRLAYKKRKVEGLCAIGGCPAKAKADHTYCLKHLQKLSKVSKKRYNERTLAALCVHCGERPQFYGVRCIICRQKFAKHPLPFGARRALRSYREAEKQRAIEQKQAEARFAVKKLLATGDVNGKRAEALELYAGIDNGKWRTYSEVGLRMNLTKERVRQLLIPSKITVSRMLNDQVPWKSMTEDTDRKAKGSPAATTRLIHCCDSPVASVETCAPYHYESLPGVILIGVSLYRCDNCQAKVAIIPQQRDLDKALSQLVLLRPASMSGRELRFLRVVNHLTIEAMATLLGVSRVTLNDWETSDALRYTNDLAARVVIASIMGAESDPRLILEILAAIRIGKVELQPIRGRWLDSEERWLVESAIPVSSTLVRK